MTGLIGAPKIILTAEQDKCKANKIIDDQAKKKEQSNREKLENTMRPILRKEVIRQIAPDESIKIIQTAKGISHLVDDFLHKNLPLKQSDLPKLQEYLRHADYEGRLGLTKPRKDDIKSFFYSKDDSRELYYHVAKRVERRKNGRIKITYFLYSMSKDNPLKRKKK